MARAGSRAYLVLLLGLSALWGSSYLFIKVAVGGLEPSTLVSFRLLASAPLLFVAPAARAGARGALSELRAARLPCLVLGILNVAAPYMLIAWGEKHVDSGVAAIATSTVPMLVALLAIRFYPSERATGLRLAGFAIGLGGVGLLAGVHPEGGWWAVVGTLAVVGASLLYAVASLYAQGRVLDVRGDVLATGSIALAGLVLLPPALVSYVFPVFAVLYGAAILDEPLSASKLGGMGAILVGVALGSGLLRSPREAAAGAAP